MVWKCRAIAPDRDGRIDAEAMVAEIDNDVALVTLGLVNAEVGTIQDVAAIAQAVGARWRCIPSRCGAGRRQDGGAGR